MNIKKMMQEAQRMQQQMLAAQEELAQKTVEATAGGGKVTVVANGAGEVVSLKIAKEVVDPEDVEFLEDLVLTAVKKAIEDGKAMQQAEMSKLMPPGMGGLGGLGF
jgi:DNA-binding YbaB/EbfC family protein